MSTTTANLGLFKYDTSSSTDLASAFNINTALNNNWDALDNKCVTVASKGSAIGGSTQPVYVNSAGQITTCDAYSSIPSGLTAEVSLSENGYIKFSNNVIIQWFYGTTRPSGAAVGIGFPISFSDNKYSVSAIPYEGDTNSGCVSVDLRDSTHVVLRYYSSNTSQRSVLCIAIGF